MRNDRRHPASTALLVVAALWTCDAPTPAYAADPPANDTKRPANCETEAVLLARRIEVRPTPDPAAAPTIVLAPGTSVYRFERRGVFLGVMFPEEGGKVDCSIRA